MIAAVAAVSLAAALTLQPFEPTRSRPRDLRSLHNFARCVAFHHPETALFYVRTAPGRPGYLRARNRIEQAGRDCNITDNPQFVTAAVLGGAVAEALYLRRHSTLPNGLAADSAATAEGETGLDSLAACVAARAPAAADALLRTVWASEAERAAMAALEPEFGHCAAGAPAGVSTTILTARAAIARAHFLRADGLASASGR